jgi:hypothetical protein
LEKKAVDISLLQGELEKCDAREALCENYLPLYMEYEGYIQILFSCIKIFMKDRIWRKHVSLTKALSQLQQVPVKVCTFRFGKSLGRSKGMKKC